MASGAGSLALGASATVGQIVDTQTQGVDTLSINVAPGPGAQNPGDPLFLPSVAIGPGAGAGNGASVAIGPDARSLAGYATAIGNLANATRGASTALGAGANATAVASTAVGASASASGLGASAIGAGASASGAFGASLGLGAQALGSNSVALGADSVANRANSVSVGSASNQRQITHVAAGTAPTDAVNLGQATALIGQATSGILAQANRHANDVAAIAAATSMSPQFGPKGYSLTAGVAGVGRAHAVGIGFARAFTFHNHPAYWQIATGFNGGSGTAAVKFGASMGW